MERRGTLDRISIVKISIVQHVDLVWSCCGTNGNTEHEKSLDWIIYPPYTRSPEHVYLDRGIRFCRIVPVRLDLLRNLGGLSSAEYHRPPLGRPRHPIIATRSGGIVRLGVREPECRKRTAIGSDFTYSPTRGFRCSASIRLVEAPRRISRDDVERVSEYRLI